MWKLLPVKTVIISIGYGVTRKIEIRKDNTIVTGMNLIRPIKVGVI